MPKQTFTQVKKELQELKDKVAKLPGVAVDKAGDLILDTKDNVFTNEELKKIKYLEGWVPVSLLIIVGLLVALIF